MAGSLPVSTITTAPATGQPLTVDGAACTSPCTFQWTPGTSHTIATNSPIAGSSGTQYVFSTWSDGLAQSHTITAPPSATTYTANFTTQYYLTTAASAGGTVSPASGWYNSGVAPQVSAAANSGYSFSGFSGALSGTATPQPVTMSAPKSVTASFSTAAVSISNVTLNSASNNITLPAGQSASLVVWLSGPAPAGGVTVTLTPSNPVLSLQGSVTIAQGATTSPAVTVTALVPTSGPVVATIYANGSAFGTFTSPQITIPTATGPLITQVSPTTGPPGTQVTITGTNFGAAQGTVAFGSVQASIYSWNPTAIVAYAPAGVSTVNLSVTVSGFAPAVSAASFAETPAPAAPSITGLSLSQGPALVGFVISGSGFGATQPAGTPVKLNGTPLTITTWGGDGSITVQVPAGTAAGGPWNVVVTIGGTASNAFPFTVKPPFGCAF